MIRRLLFWALALTALNDPLLAVGDEPLDPYLWLEDVAGANALAWVKERNAESTSELTRSERFQSLERRLLEVLDSEARIPAIQKLGPYYYNFWRDARNPRGLWRRTTLEEYRKAKPNWEVVLDLDALGKEEKENCIRIGCRASDSVFVGTDFGSGSLTESGYPRIVKEWKRGTPLSEAVVVFEGQPSDVSVSAFRDLTPGFELRRRRHRGIDSFHCWCQ